jgi:hypothetical protein
MLEAGYSVSILLDTAFFVSAGKMLPNGHDLRIVYWSGAGWTELNRHILHMNTSSTDIWFKTQMPIDSTSSDGNYYIYYGFSGATNPLEDKSQVYLWFDDFSANTLNNYDRAKWVDIHGSPSDYIAPSYDAVNQRVIFDTGDDYASDMYPTGVIAKDYLMEVDFWADRSYPNDATIALVGRLQNPGTSSTHYYLDFSHGTYDSPGITVDSWTTGERSNTIYSSPSDFYWAFNTIHSFKYAIFGNTQKFWWNKNISQPADIVVTDGSHTSAGRVGLAPAQVRGWWDNLKIRKYVEPEPSTVLGLEESLGENRLDIDGVFTFDINVYPLAYIKGVEIQLRYRTGDISEKWHLEAYNWTTGTFSNSGFNSTTGHLPTTDWSIYSVNFTDEWQSYMKADGQMRVKFHDAGTDDNQTIVDIDFLGVILVIDGTNFTFKNAGALTSHIVSIWVVNSATHIRYETNVYINAGETISYIRGDISLGNTTAYFVKATTERGNIAVYLPS